MSQNPYSAGGQSEHLIDRAVIVALGELIAGGRADRGLVLLGGPGSGKTTALMQLERLLQRENLSVHRLDDRETTESACHSRVCHTLRTTPSYGLPNCTDAIERWLKNHLDQRLVLLFDEFGAQLEDRGRGFFNALESVRKTHARRLVVLLAGGAQLMRFELGSGSPFLSRARREILSPLGAADIELLASRFDRDLGRPLAPDTLDAIRILTGGNAFLTTHVLQRLWEAPPEERTVERVADILDDESELGSFKASFESAIEARQTARPMRLVWDHMVSRPSPYDLRELEQLCQSEPGLRAETVLLFLEAAGLLRRAGHGRIVECELIPTILRPLQLGESTEEGGTLQQRLDRDVARVLLEIHSNGVDYHRTEGRKTDKKRELVPEAVFSAFICSALRLLGWDAEREVQRTEGRIDVRARHIACPTESGVVEVKIWGRQGYKTVGEQAAGYHQCGVTAFTAVTLADLARVDDWADRFASECLRGTHERLAIEGPLAGGFRAMVTTADNAVVTVTHLLLRVPGHQDG